MIGSAGAPHAPPSGRFQRLERWPGVAFFDPVQIQVVRDPSSASDLSAVGVSAEPTSPRVTRLYINASQRCNLRCTYCFADFGRRYDGPSAMEPGLARAAIDWALNHLDPEVPRLRLVFFGGEPWLAFDQCVDLLAYACREARRKPRKVCLSGLFVTNFTTATKADLARLAGLPVDISVSVDGGAADHDRHRVFASGRGTWATVAGNVRRLRPHVPGVLSAICTISAKNLDLVQIVADVMSLGFDQMCVRHVFCPDPRVNLDAEGIDRLIAGYEQSARANLEQALQGAPAEFELFRVHFEILHQRTAARFPCGAGREWFTLTTAGNLYPCPEFAPAFPLGTAAAGADAPAVAQFAGAIGVQPGRPCGTCRARPFCRGGCPAEAYHLTGKHDATIEARCRLAQAIGDLAAGLYLELSDRRPEILARYVGYRRSEAPVVEWPGQVVGGL